MHFVAGILVVAANGGGSGNTLTALLLGGLAVALIVGGIALIALVRKKLMGDDTLDLTGNFTLSDLRRLLADGRISQEEYDRAKRIILEQSRQMLAEEEADSDKG